MNLLIFILYTRGETLKQISEIYPSYRGDQYWQLSCYTVVDTLLKAKRVTIW